MMSHLPQLRFKRKMGKISNHRVEITSFIETIIYDPDLYKIYFTRDPTVLKPTISIILPVGSPPGIWGLAVQ